MGIIGNAILSIIKIIVGFISGSMAVLGDGIDSASDILTSIITLYTAKMVNRPPNLEYAYGYKRADTVASKVLAFIIFFAGAQLAISTINKLIDGHTGEIPGKIALVVTVISIFGKIFLARYQMSIGKKTDSSMLRANGKNMQNDVIISLTVLIGLGLTFILKIPIADILTAGGVSIYIMYTAFQIFLESNKELLDGIEDTSIYEKIYKAASSVKGVFNPHRIRVRKMGDQYLISLDIEVDSNICVKESHKLCHSVEENINHTIPAVYDIRVHAEPLGDKHPDEVYGIGACDLPNCYKKK
ncbi:MAG: cation diffusion facilitator family transporter [Hyphomicrobiales bacterium]